MKKQYMDFVPTAKRPSGTKKPVKEKTVVMPNAKPRVKKTVAKPTVKKVARTSAVKPVAKSVVKPAKRPIPKPTEAVAFSGEKMPKLGMIEDLNPKFVKTDVPKRPLSSRATNGSHFRAEKTGIAATKAQKIGNRANTKNSVRTEVKPVEKSVENSKKSLAAKSTYQPPKNPFINQGKVEKRPLSKNVYTKKVAIPKEILKEPKGPVTIISKPEKDAPVGLIVAIILTIILGAAAGTVAFLLLPK